MDKKYSYSFKECSVGYERNVEEIMSTFGWEFVSATENLIQAGTCRNFAVETKGLTGSWDYTSTNDARVHSNGLGIFVSSVVSAGVKATALQSASKLTFRMDTEGKDYETRMEAYNAFESLVACKGIASKKLAAQKRIMKRRVGKFIKDTIWFVVFGAVTAVLSIFGLAKLLQPVVAPAEGEAAKQLVEVIGFNKYTIWSALAIVAGVVALVLFVFFVIRLIQMIVTGSRKGKLKKFLKVNEHNIEDSASAIFTAVKTGSDSIVNAARNGQDLADNLKVKLAKFKKF